MKTVTINVAGVVEEVGVVTGKITINPTRGEVAVKEVVAGVMMGTSRTRLKKIVDPTRQRSQP